MVEGDDGSLNDELSCYDVTDLTNPILSYSVGRPTPMYDIQVIGDLAYIGAGGWLALSNVSDPTSFTYPGSLVDTSFGVCNFGQYVMSAALDEGIKLFNAIDVSNLQLHSEYPDSTAALQVTISGDYTYVANKTSLVILRHFCSAADTFDPVASIAQSHVVNSIDASIIKATLNKDDNIPLGTNIDYYMSADGGANWEAVTPGVEHEFVNAGNDLRWKAEFSGPLDASARLYEISINYTLNAQPSIPRIIDPGGVSTTGNVTITWDASTDDLGISHYKLEVGTGVGLAILSDSYYPNDTSFTVTGLSSGTHYFRVRAVDIYGLASNWSRVVDIDVQFPTTGLPWWINATVGGILAFISIIIIIVIIRKQTNLAG